MRNLQTTELLAAARSAACREGKVVDFSEVLHVTDEEAPTELAPMEALDSSPEFTSAAASSGPSLRSDAEPRPVPGRTVYKTASHTELWSQGWEPPSRASDSGNEPTPESRMDPGARARRKALEKKIQKRAEEVEVKWREADASFRGRHVRDLSQDGNHRPKSREALEKQCVRIDRVEDLKRSVEARKARAEATLADASLSERERKMYERKLRRYDAQLERVGKAENNVVAEAEKVVDQEGLRLDLLARAEAQLDPHSLPQERLGALLSEWLVLVTQANRVLNDLAQNDIQRLRTSRLRAEEAAEDAESEEAYRRSLRAREERVRASLPTPTSHHGLRIIRG